MVGRALKAFYDDQMTHHAAALTYYALMSLFPAVLLALALLGLIGQYPSTYNAIIDYLRDVAPASAVDPIDSSLRSAFQHKGTAATALAISVLVAFYGTTGLLEGMRRALNVLFELEGTGRRILGFYHSHPDHPAAPSRFDQEHATMLSASAPERFTVLHRLHAHVLRPAS